MPIPRPIPRREGNSRAGISGAPGSVPAGNRIEHPGKDESPPIGNTTKTEGLSTGSAKSTPTFRSHPHPYANCRNSYKARFQRGLVPTAAPPPKFSAQLRPVGRFYLCFPVILRVRPGACGLAGTSPVALRSALSSLEIGANFFALAHADSGRPTPVFSTTPQPHVCVRKTQPTGG